MTHTPHSLADDFPMKAERIHLLKISDPRFNRLIEQYRLVTRAIHRAETKVAPVDHLVERTMRKERLTLKDEISALLA